MSRAEGDNEVLKLSSEERGADRDGKKTGPESGGPGRENQPCHIFSRVARHFTSSSLGLFVTTWGWLSGVPISSGVGQGEQIQHMQSVQQNTGVQQTLAVIPPSLPSSQSNQPRCQENRRHHALHSRLPLCKRTSALPVPTLLFQGWAVRAHPCPWALGSSVLTPEGPVLVPAPSCLHCQPASRPS